MNSVVWDILVLKRRGSTNVSGLGLRSTFEVCTNAAKQQSSRLRLIREGGRVLGHSKRLTKWRQDTTITCAGGKVSIYMDYENFR